jgi:hypothetical protein
MKNGGRAAGPVQGDRLVRGKIFMSAPYRQGRYCLLSKARTSFPAAAIGLPCYSPHVRISCVRT